MPILVTLDGISTLVSPLQPDKAEVPMLVQIPTNATSLILAQADGNVLSIRVTKGGMDTLVSALQPEKASEPMLITPDGMAMLVSALHPAKA